MKNRRIKKIKCYAPALAISLLLSMSNALASPEEDHAAPLSLCAASEKVIFSCDIGSKKLSLCATGSATDPSSTLVQYRFGKPGNTPELAYPSKPSSPLSSFEFGTIKNTSGFPIETVSFERPGAAYDICTTSKESYARWAPFTGIGVTITGKPTKLLRCKQGTIFVDLEPLKKAIGIAPEDRLSEAIPKLPVEKKPFEIEQTQRPCGSKCECNIEYPVISDSNVSTEIKSFVAGTCENGAETSLTVSATMIGDAYLSLSFSDYTYHYGTPHGLTYEHKKTYKKSQNGWKEIAKDELFDSSEKCRNKVNSLLYRRLKPLGLSRLESPEGLLKSAKIEISSQGIIFSYDQYELGAYAEGPHPVLIPYKSLGSCMILGKEPNELD